jgi:hypothetical protein
VSLQGTFDTLSVTELFGLLSTAAKTGALRLEACDLEGTDHEAAGAHQATVFVAGGLCCAVESDEVGGPPASDEELAGRLVDVGFSLARCPSGSFRFTDDERPPFDAAVRTSLEPAVAAIGSLLEQWREIEATIPSLDSRVRLAPVLRAEEIVVSAHEWGLLVALEGLPSVRELVARRGQPMIEVCRSLKDLVDRGAIEVGADLGMPYTRVPDLRVERGRHAHDVDTTDPSAHIDVLEPYAPVTVAADSIAAAEAADAVAAGLVSRMTRPRRSVPDVFAGADEPSPGSEAAASSSEPEPADVPQDRSALLRLFSGLKES